MEYMIIGDLVFFHGLGTSILVLNTLKSIDDLLDKRGNIYSDRPVSALQFLLTLHL